MQQQQNLQLQINALAAKFGSDHAGLGVAVRQLIAEDRAKASMLGLNSFGQHSNQNIAQHASTSAVGQPTPPVSSRGRIIKPMKPYSSSPAPAPRHIAPQQQQRRSDTVTSGSPNPSLSSSSAFHRPGSSLNPANVNRPPTRVPLSSDAIPVPPMSRITAPRYQAMYTTYPARMRLGTSSLMQPNYLAATGTGTSTPGGGKRARAVVNYAEIEGLEDSDDNGNDSEARAARRAGGYPGAIAPKKIGLGLNGVGEEGKRAVWGDGKSYLGVLPPGNLVIVQPARSTKHVTYSDEQLAGQADSPAIFVPIQLEFDIDTFKVRDCFVWNINEKLVTPESFARVFCDDLDLPSSYVAKVAVQITEQCEEQAGVAEIAVRGAEEEAEDVEKDLRVVLNLDVQIGTLHLVDRVEWDLSSPLTPELFAAVLVRDLSLSSSAAPLISHAVHEELFRHKKNCLEMGLVGDDAMDHGMGRKRGAKRLEGVWREWNDSLNYGPRVEILSLDEMDRVEADRERAIRRAKRDRLTGSRTAGRRR